MRGTTDKQLATQAQQGVYPIVSRVSAFSGLECWTGVLEWSTGMESLEWSEALEWACDKFRHFSTFIDREGLKP